MSIRHKYFLRKKNELEKNRGSTQDMYKQSYINELLPLYNNHSYEGQPHMYLMSGFLKSDDYSMMPVPIIFLAAVIFSDFISASSVIVICLYYFLIIIFSVLISNLLKSFVKSQFPKLFPTEESLGRLSVEEVRCLYIKKLNYLTGFYYYGKILLLIVSVFVIFVRYTNFNYFL